MKNFSYSAIGFFSLLLVLICFTSCEQQEVLTDIAPNEAPPLELLVNSSQTPDDSTMPTDLSVPNRTADNSNILDERGPCYIAGNQWMDSREIGRIWMYDSYSIYDAGGAWAWSDRHRVVFHISAGQEYCDLGMLYYTTDNISGYSGNFWDNSANDNWVYSYSAGRWIQH